MKHVLLLPSCLLAACAGPDPDGSSPDDTSDSDVVVTPRGEAPTIDPAAPTLKRLTNSQYRHALRDLFGPDLVLPTNLEPDVRIEGLLSTGASRTTISPYGVEKYGEAAQSVASQVLEDPTRRARWVDCTPSLDDEACTTGVLQRLGRRAWRRPLSTDELDVAVDLAVDAGTALSDASEGLGFGIAYLLTSPHFLYRVELGDRQGAPEGAYDGFELASRLAFFLWDTLPDDALLTAAETGDLTTDAGLAAQVDRMLADPLAIDGVRALFSEMLHLDELPRVIKDPAIFTYWRDSLRASAAEETLRGIQALVFEDDGSYLDLFTTQRTFLDGDLATLYDVPATAREGFGEVWLPEEQGRRGLLGQASFLMLQAHPVSTSVTRRGVFIREVLLCEEVPEPPANANTAIPEADENARTMRERIAVHLQNPACATCHEMTDPVALGLETFDGLGRARTTENGAPIDPTSELDGQAYANAWELAQRIVDHPHTAPCFTETVVRYATGAVAAELPAPLVDWHTEGFVGGGHHVLALLRDVALSPAFRRVGEVQ